MIDQEPNFIKRTGIEGLLVIERPKFSDERGFFQELWRLDDIAKVLGRKVVLKQGNYSLSRPGVIRGLHVEPQDKIVTPLTGRMFVAIADLRDDSETFASVCTFVFDPNNICQSLFIPQGLANSICVMGQEPVRYVYAVSTVFDATIPKMAVRWDDPVLNIPWPIDHPILSEDDRKHPFLRQLFPEKFSSQP